LGSNFTFSEHHPKLDLLSSGIVANCKNCMAVIILLFVKLLFLATFLNFDFQKEVYLLIIQIFKAVNGPYVPIKVSSC
jgi:hypothetical protein